MAAAFGAEGLVELDRQRFLELLPTPAPALVSPDAAVVRRDVRIDPAARTFEATFELRAPRPTWVDLLLVGPDATVAEAVANGITAPLVATPDGHRLVRRVVGTLVVKVRGTLDEDVHQLALAPAAIGTVDLAGALDLVVPENRGLAQVEDLWWTGAGLLTWREPPPTTSARQVVIGQVGVGLTVREGELVGRGRVRWVARRGELSEVAFRAEGVGHDLQVTGPSVAAWRREGDRVHVELVAPQSSTMVALSWTTAIPAGDEARLVVPRIAPENVLRGEVSLQLARDGDVDFLPELQDWQAIPAADLDEVGRGLVVGTPTAAYRAPDARPGALALHRFEPVSGPPVLIDVAACTVATTEEGRTLIRALYQVRNDRAPWLRVTPPPGSVVLGARVAGKTANVGIDGETWLVPLAKSVETVEGLLSFPVEVVLLGEIDGWSARDGVVGLPAVDAPVALTQATLHLPPGWRNAMKAGENDSVDSFAEGAGLAYGLAVGDARAVAADNLMQRAVQAWMGNDFDAASDALDQIEALGVVDDNVGKLRSNLDVLSGKESTGEVALERRVKDQAKARSKLDVARQEIVLQEAEEAWNAGDYGRASQAYGEAASIGEKLEATEQDESVEIAAKNDLLQSKQVAAEKKVAEAAPPETLTKEFVQRVPSGRSYQSAVGTEAGVAGGGGNPNIAGGVTNENTYLLDGAEIDETEVEPILRNQELATEARRPGLSLPEVRFGRNKPADDPKPAVAEATIEVTATSLSVVVPSHGEAVRYQHYLLPPGEPLLLEVRARTPRRRPPQSRRTP